MLKQAQGKNGAECKRVRGGGNTTVTSLAIEGQETLTWSSRLQRSSINSDLDLEDGSDVSLPSGTHQTGANNSDEADKSIQQSDDNNSRPTFKSPAKTVRRFPRLIPQRCTSIAPRNRLQPEPRLHDQLHASPDLMIHLMHLRGWVERLLLILELLKSDSGHVCLCL